MREGGDRERVRAEEGLPPVAAEALDDDVRARGAPPRRAREDVRRGHRDAGHRRRALRGLLRRRVRARAQTKHARGPDRRDRVWSGGAPETEYTFVGGFSGRARAPPRRPPPPRGRVPRARGHLVRAGSSPGRGDRFARRHRGSGRGRRSLSRSERDAGGGVGVAVPRRERTPRRRRGGRKEKPPTGPAASRP